MRKLRFVLTVPALGALLAAQTQTPPLVIRGVTVIGVTGGAAERNRTVVIEGGRIAAIAKNVKAPKGAQVVDGRGKFLIPGLWDMHVHTVEPNFLRLYVVNGVTGVRDMFSPINRIQQWRKEIATGRLVGPRFMAAGPIVDGPKPVWPGSVGVATEAEARAAVAKVKALGADFVKVYSLLPREAYFAIADEAKKQGLPFAGHVPESVTAIEASDAGQKSFEHSMGVFRACSSKEADLQKEALDVLNGPDTGMGLRRLLRSQVKTLLETFDERKATALFERLAKNGTWVDPTLTVLRAISLLNDENFTKDPRLKYIGAMTRGFWDPKKDSRFQEMDAEQYEWSKRAVRRHMELIGRMRRAGVRLLAGTDTPNPYCFPGFSLHDELALLVEAGLTPLEALQAATRNPARYFGIESTTGTVEKGKIADLVLLDANPLENIRNTQRIAAVVVGGRLIDRRALDAMLAEVEAAAAK